MSDWTGVKPEDSGTFFASASAGTESSVHPTAAESFIDPEQGLAETEQVFQVLPPTTIPSERQRTVQACDKCRERKTKCSGEHPACQRCKTRGLICQYSSREPRTRGPSKARLRNAVSSTDLRSSVNPRIYSHGPQSIEAERPFHQQRHPTSKQYDTLHHQPMLRRVASIPRDSSHRVHISTQGFETVREAYTQPFRYDGSYDPAFPTPPSQYTSPNPRVPQWRDVRRVQSHSTLIGSSGGGLSRSTPQYNYSSPHSFGNPTGPASYEQWPLEGRMSPTSIAMFNAFEYPVLPGAPLEPQLPHHNSSEIRPWSYHSDGGSTGSEPMPGEQNIVYSPSSSEEVSEATSRCTSSHGAIPTSDPNTFTQPSNFANYTHYDAEVDTHIHRMPSQNGCAPQFHSSSTFIPDNHYNPQHSASESDRQAQYRMVYPS